MGRFSLLDRHTDEISIIIVFDSAYALSIILSSLNTSGQLLKFIPVPGPTKGTWLEICHFNLLASTLLYVSSLNEKIANFFCFVLPIVQAIE